MQQFASSNSLTLIPPLLPVDVMSACFVGLSVSLSMFCVRHMSLAARRSELLHSHHAICYTTKHSIWLHHHDYLYSACHAFFINFSHMGPYFTAEV
jgi:hypothetical protein